jgi:exosortase/archaeosortase family protein
MVSAFPLAILGNLARMLCIVVAAELGGQEAGNYVHNSSLFSLVPYLPVIIGLLIAGRWLERNRGPDAKKQS